MSLDLNLYPSISVSISFSLCLSICRPICLSIHRALYLSIALAIYLSFDSPHIECWKLQLLKSGPKARAFERLTSTCASCLGRLQSRVQILKGASIHKCSETMNLSYFWIPNALHAQAARLFSMMKGNRRTVARNACKITRVILSHHFISKFCFENYESWKVLWTSQFLTILASTCSSCLGRVLFWTPEAIKNGSTMVCLHDFDFQLRFAPRTRAIFDCWICQKCFGPAVLFFAIASLLRTGSAKSGGRLRCVGTFDVQMCFAPGPRPHGCSKRFFRLRAPHPPLARGDLLSHARPPSSGKHSASRQS